MLRWCLALMLAVSLLPGCAPSRTSPASVADRLLASSYESQRSDIQVTGSGSVVGLLPDDNEGSRHQRFIIELDSGQTLLISHNIDVAPRIPAVAVGDAIDFNGVYEWNAEGGVIHWTHHDPDGSHEAGWLDHKGLRYQ